MFTRRFCSVALTAVLLFSISAVSLQARDFGRAYGRSFGRSFGHHFGRDFGRSWGRSYGRGFGPSFGYGFRGYSRGYSRGYYSGYYGGYYGYGYRPRFYGYGYGSRYGGWSFGFSLGIGYPYAHSLYDYFPYASYEYYPPRRGYGYRTVSAPSPALSYATPVRHASAPSESPAPASGQDYDSGYEAGRGDGFKDNQGGSPFQYRSAQYGYAGSYERGYRAGYRAGYYTRADAAPAAEANLR